MNKIIIAPSMLSSDLSNLEYESRRMLEAGADWLHMDIMDAHFVPNLTFGYPVLESLRKKLPNAHLDCHLMIENPIKWVTEIVKTANSVSFHIEACNDINDTKEIINEFRKYNIKLGIALNPDTPLVNVYDILDKQLVDYLLIMTVIPGFSGQSFHMKCLEKIALAHKRYPNLDIQVDGGINLETFQLCLEKGANIFVSGSTIFKCKEPKELIMKFRK